MKKYIYILLACLSMTGCSNFLDTDNLVRKDSSNFPKDLNDLETALTSVYAANSMVMKGANWQIFPLISEVMADYTLSGATIGATQARAMAEYQKDRTNMYSPIWARYYKGIYRANFVIENAEKVEGDDQDTRNQILGEALFMRAKYYFDMARMFERVPLLTTTESVNKPQSEPEEIFQLILSDLVSATKLLPAVKYQQIPTARLGHATRWAAEGMIGRVYLYYSGLYGKESITLADGTTFGKQQAIDMIDDCIANSGHDLIPDFRNLWPYAYSNKDYDYAKKNNLQWIGEEGANCETVFAIKFSALGSSQNVDACNNFCLYLGIRNKEYMPWGKGWGWCSVVPKVYQEWPDNDLRKKASILNMKDPAEKINYKPHASVYNETGYFAKKYMPVNVKDDKGKLVNYSCILYGIKPNFQYNNTQDLVVIRFADVLLMGAELGSAHAQEYMDRVRARVGLESVPPTLENIKKERLHELFFEGVRFYDLKRWGDVEQEVNRMQKDVPVIILQNWTKVTKTYRAASRGFLPIPEDQIQLSNGVLQQNPGWEGTEGMYSK